MGTKPEEDHHHTKTIMPHVWWHQCALWHEKRLRCPFLDDEEEDDDNDNEDPEEHKRTQPSRTPGALPVRDPVPTRILRQAARVPVPVRVKKGETSPIVTEFTGVPTPAPPGVPGDPIPVPIPPIKRPTRAPPPHRAPKVPKQPPVPKKVPVEVPKRLGERGRQLEFTAKKAVEPGHKEIIEAFRETGFQTSEATPDEFSFPLDAVSRAAAAERLLTRSIRMLMNRSNPTSVDAVAKNPDLTQRSVKLHESRRVAQDEEQFQRQKGKRQAETHRTERRLKKQKRLQAEAKAREAGRQIKKNITRMMPAPQAGGRGGGLHVNAAERLKRLTGRK